MDYFKDKLLTFKDYFIARCDDTLIYGQSSFILDNTGAFPENLNILIFENIQKISEYISQIYQGNEFNTNINHLNKKDLKDNMII